MWRSDSRERVRTGWPNVDLSSSARLDELRRRARRSGRCSGSSCSRGYRHARSERSHSSRRRRRSSRRMRARVRRLRRRHRLRKSGGERRSGGATSGAADGRRPLGHGRAKLAEGGRSKRQSNVHEPQPAAPSRTLVSQLAQSVHMAMAAREGGRGSGDNWRSAGGTSFSVCAHVPTSRTCVVRRAPARRCARVDGRVDGPLWTYGAKFSKKILKFDFFRERRIDFYFGFVVYILLRDKWLVRMFARSASGGFRNVRF